MGKLSIMLVVVLLAGAFTPPCLAANYVAANLTPPPPPREFRAAWIATVANIDWPSQKNLSTAAQKAELVSILDRAAKLGLNAIIFQVRPACDALYASPLEPWSEYLTGVMGKPPEPFYDPLAFAVEEAHKRALELHAWFNPYRAHHPSARSPIAATHVSKTKPQLVRQYGNYLWLDPGEREVQEHSLDVVLDVVKRYDVDGVHFDDYFYPYKISANGREVDFPDEASWQKYRAGAPSGGLERNDWRRENVNIFIERVYQSVKATKPWVKFGLSPFGIWRPQHPGQIRGLDAYDQLYADSRKWLASGWVDYLAPQLYWAIEPKEQSFPVLLNWWNEQNPKQRHIWPGLNTTRVRDQTTTRTNSQARPNWKPEEIVSQIRLAARQPVSGGHIHWNATSLLRSGALQTALGQGPYAEPALIPASAWLNSITSAKPQLAVVAGAASVKLSWETNGAVPVSNWVVQFQRGGKWTTRILPAAQRSLIVDGELPAAVALSAANRVGKLSPPATLALQK